MIADTTVFSLRVYPPIPTLLATGLTKHLASLFCKRCIAVVKGDCIWLHAHACLHRLTLVHPLQIMSSKCCIFILLKVNAFINRTKCFYNRNLQTHVVSVGCCHRVNTITVSELRTPTSYQSSAHQLAMQVKVVSVKDYRYELKSGLAQGL